MKLLDRYISAVAHYLPESRRDDITRELRSNILDQLECVAERDNQPASEAQVAEVLVAMGHPQKVAHQFLPSKQLVTEELWPLYKHVLGYAFVLVFLVELVKLGLAFISVPYAPLAGLSLGYAFNMLCDLLGGFINNSLLAFAVITGVFYVLSNPPGGKPLIQPYRHWWPEQLPPVVFGWQRISVWSQAGEIAMSSLVLLAVYHQVWIPEHALQGLVVQLSDAVYPWLHVMGAVTVALLIFNHWNIRYGYWTQSKLAISIILNCALVVIFLAVSRLPALFLPTDQLTVDMQSLVGVIDGVFRVGFMMTALYFLYEAGRDLYRLVLLRKA